MPPKPRWGPSCAFCGRHIKPMTDGVGINPWGDPWPWIYKIGLGYERLYFRCAGLEQVYCTGNTSLPAIDFGRALEDMLEQRRVNSTLPEWIPEVGTEAPDAYEEREVQLREFAISFEDGGFGPGHRMLPQRESTDEAGPEDTDRDLA